MTDKENSSISFEEVWKSLEEQDKTGVYKRAREMADIAVDQLEYAYNSGYESAKAKYARPQGEWILIDDVGDPEDRLNRYKCSECGRIIKIYEHQTFSDYPFCHCGARMKGGLE